MKSDGRRLEFGAIAQLILQKVDASSQRSKQTPHMTDLTCPSRGDWLAPAEEIGLGVMFYSSIQCDQMVVDVAWSMQSDLSVTDDDRWVL